MWFVLEVVFQTSNIINGYSYRIHVIFMFIRNVSDFLRKSFSNSSYIMAGTKSSLCPLSRAATTLYCARDFYLLEKEVSQSFPRRTVKKYTTFYNPSHSFTFVFCQHILTIVLQFFSSVLSFRSLMAFFFWRLLILIGSRVMRSYTIWYLGFDSFDSIWFDWKYQICFEKKNSENSRS